MENNITVRINRCLITDQNVRQLSPSAHFMASLIAMGHFFPDPYSVFSRARIYQLPPPLDSDCLITLELRPGSSKALTSMQLRIKGVDIVELVTVGPVPADLSLLGKQTVFAQRCPSALALDGPALRSVRVLIPSAELPGLLSFDQLMDNQRLRFRCVTACGEQYEIRSRDLPAPFESLASGRSSPMSISGLKTPRSFDSPKMYARSAEHPPLLPLQALEPAEPPSSPVKAVPAQLASPVSGPPAISMLNPLPLLTPELKRDTPLPCKPLALSLRATADVGVQAACCESCGAALPDGPNGMPARLLCPHDSFLRCAMIATGYKSEQQIRYFRREREIRTAQNLGPHPEEPPDFDEPEPSPMGYKSRRYNCLFPPDDD